MKRIFAQFLLSIFQVVMIFTLTLAPVPFMDNVSVVYAQDDVRDDCDEDQNDNDNGRPGVYKPGCDFNEALVKAQENSSGDGMVGVIEQFAAAAFGLAAINSVVFTQHPLSQLDCPGYMTPQITLRIMQGGSLAYILGNIQSNQKFKKAAKDAVDVELTPQAKRDERVEDKDLAVKNRKFNQKQLDSYMALIKVYQAKVEALEQKENMSMLAELAYLGALGTEIGMTSTYAGKCISGEVIDKSLESTIAAAITKAAAAAAADTSTNYSCAKAQPVITLKGGNHLSSEAETAAVAAANMTEDIASSVSDQGYISKLFSSFASVFTLGVAGFFLANTSPNTAEVKDAAAEKEAVSNDAVEATIFASQGSTTTAVQTSCADCPACTSVVAGVIIPQEAAKTGHPFICCGTRLHKVPSGWSANVPAPGKINIEKDVIIPPIIVRNENLEFTKYVVSGFLQQYMLNKIEKGKLSVTKKVEFIKKAIKQQERFENDFYQIIESEQFKRTLANYESDFKLINLENDKMGFQKYLDKIKSNLIAEARASSFGEFMGLGIKMLGLQLAMGQFLRNTALTSPQNRMYTFGIMAAVNAGLMKFNGDSADEAKRRLEIVKNEARSFAESHALKTSFDEEIVELSKKASPEEIAKLNAAFNNGIVTCADPKGNSFVPAQCPSKLRPSNVNFPLDPDTKRRFNNTPLGRALPLISDAAYNTASGKGSSQSGGTTGGKLTELGKMRGAIRKQVDELAGKYDKEILGTQKEKFGFNATPLASSNLKFRKLYNGDPAKNGVSKSMLAGLEGKLADIDDIKEQSDKSSGKVAAYTPPKFDTPKTDNFKFDLGGDSGTIVDHEQRSGALQEGELSDFQVNAADVNERTDANIFKIISNRYLKSYPVLLEERE